jgi:hypothetical protein
MCALMEISGQQPLKNPFPTLVESEIRSLGSIIHVIRKMLHLLNHMATLLGAS